MPASLQKQIARQKAIAELELSKIAAGRARKLSELAAKNKYDVMQPAAQRKRRQAAIERESEEKLLKLYDRLRAVNLCRDLERNFTSAKSIINQMRVNVA